jgi:hypothetical protein
MKIQSAGVISFSLCIDSINSAVSCVIISVLIIGREHKRADQASNVDGCLPWSPNTAQLRVVRVRASNHQETVKPRRTVIRFEHGDASGGVEACAKMRKGDGLQLMRLAGSGYRCHGRPAQVPARCPCSGNEWDEPPA